MFKADAHFWFALATEFDALDPGGGVCAHRAPYQAVMPPDWHDPHHQGQRSVTPVCPWRLEGPSCLVEKLMDLARQGAIALGTLDSEDAWAEWFDLLRCWSSDYREDGITTGMNKALAYDDGKEYVPEDHLTAGLPPAPPVTIVQGPRSETRSDFVRALVCIPQGRIDNPSQASARFCRKLAREVALQGKATRSPQHGEQPGALEPAPQEPAGGSDHAETLAPETDAKPSAGGSAAAWQVFSADVTRRYPERATWLKETLKALGLSANELYLHYKRPDRKSTAKVLRGEWVRVDVLERLVDSLTTAARDRHSGGLPPKVFDMTDVPNA